MRKLRKGSEHMAPTTAEQHIIDIMTWQETRPGRRRPYASSVAYCPRQNFLMARPQPGTTRYESTSAVYMGIGIGVEDFMYRRFQDTGHALGTNLYIPRYPEFGIDIGGKIDIIGIDHNGDTAMWEIKTCGKIPDTPKLSHLRQAQVYAIFGGFESAYLTYFSRDVRNHRDGSLKMKTFTIDTSAAALEPVLSRVFYTFSSLSEGWMPMKPPEFRKSTECGYCPFKKDCWGGVLDLANDDYSQLSADDHEEQMGIANQKALEFFELGREPYRRMLVAMLSQDDLSEDHIKRLKKELDETEAELSI